MKILFVIQFFDGPEDPGSDRWYRFAHQLADRGHEVVVLTSPVNYKEARLKDKLLPAYHSLSGGSASVEYVYSFADIRGSYFRRYIYFLTFFFTAAWRALRLGRPDVVYAVSTPLSVGLLGALISRFRRVPFFFEVTDVWPDAAIAVGVLRSRIAIFLATRVERLAYASARRIVCLTAGIRDNLARKGVPAAKLLVATNGVDLELFVGRDALASQRDKWRSQWGVADKFVCLYIGAHGKYNSLHTLIEAAARLKEYDGIAFVLVGEGDAKQDLERSVEKAGLRNVHFVGAVPRAQTPGILSAGDCFALPILRGEFFDLNLPNKFFDYLASEAPILVAGQCEAGRVVKEADAGVVTPAEDALALAEAIRHLWGLGIQSRLAMAQRGRAIAEKRYSREAIFGPIVDEIECTASEIARSG